MLFDEPVCQNRDATPGLAMGCDLHSKGAVAVLSSRLKLRSLSATGSNRIRKQVAFGDFPLEDQALEASTRSSICFVERKGDSATIAVFLGAMSIRILVQSDTEPSSLVSITNPLSAAINRMCSVPFVLVFCTSPASTSTAPMMADCTAGCKPLSHFIVGSVSSHLLQNCSSS